MIEIGLTGWGDHDLLYGERVRAGDKLAFYAKHFNVVEIDSTFYAIQSQEVCRKWAEATPGNFRFVVKAYKGLTGHEQRQGQPATEGESQHFEQRMASFLESIEPIVQSGKLLAVLFQYPPWFDCTREHVNELRMTKRLVGNIPAALEFRHNSWFSEEYAPRTLQFMQSEKWIHSICDEPQAEPFCIPTVLEVTHPQVTVVRMHGRNITGWINKEGVNWREVRYLYRYSMKELEEWAKHLTMLEGKSEQIYVLFNNNSGGDAAGNAKQLQELLGQEVPPFAPEQLELF